MGNNNKFYARNNSSFVFTEKLPIYRLARRIFFMDRKNEKIKQNIIASSKKSDAGEKKMRILFSSYDSIGNSFYGGGGATAIHEVAKRLTEKYMVTIICGAYPFAQKRIIDGVLYEYVGISYFGPKLGQLIYHFILIFVLISRKFDIWIESFTPPFSTSFLPLFTKKPVIGLVHMLSAEDMFRKYKIPFQFIENLGIKTYRHFIVLTQESDRKIKKINFRARIEIIPNGVNLALPDNKLEKKHFLFIGRIEINQKGLDLLLKAYKLIEKKTNYSLAIVGQGSSCEEKKLIEIIHKLEISDRVKFLDRLEGAEKLKMFQEAAAVIIPSRFETFSLVALESLSQNVPVISFDIKGLKWLPADFSAKAKPFDVSCLARKMLEMSAGSNSLKMDKSKVKNFLADYNWDVISGKYEKYFNSIIKAKLKK